MINIFFIQLIFSHAQKCLIDFFSHKMFDFFFNSLNKIKSNKNKLPEKVCRLAINAYFYTETDIREKKTWMKFNFIVIILLPLTRRKIKENS